MTHEAAEPNGSMTCFICFVGSQCKVFVQRLCNDSVDMSRYQAEGRGSWPMGLMMDIGGEIMGVTGDEIMGVTRWWALLRVGLT